MLSKRNLRCAVPLPDGLTADHIYDALEKTQKIFSLIKKKTGVTLSKIIQANNFSGIVSNVFTKMLDECSPYKKLSDQDYPDLRNPLNEVGLEVKATKKAFKGGEGHNGHSGWHIIVCYVILEHGEIDFSLVEVAELIGFGERNSDWIHMKARWHRSKGHRKSRRTDTLSTNSKGTAKLRDGTIYFNKEYCTISKNLKNERKKVKLKIPAYSIFAE